MLRKRKLIIIFFVVLFISVTSKGMAITEPVSELTSQLDSIEYKAQDLKDPFQPDIKPGAAAQIQPEQIQVAKEEKLPDLVIQGLVWGVSRPQAIINNKVVKIGDTIEGVSITKIDKDGIVVVLGNQNYSLPSPGNLNSNLKNVEK